MLGENWFWSLLGLRRVKQILCFFVHSQQKPAKDIINNNIIGWGFCVNQNNQGQGKCYQLSRRPRLITLTETLIIWDITKTESSNCFIIVLKKIMTDTPLQWTWIDIGYWKSCTASATYRSLSYQLADNLTNLLVALISKISYRLFNSQWEDR